MEKWLGKYSNFFYALLRIVAGALFACHGAQKLFGWFGGPKQSGLLFVAGVIEFFGGLLIAAGLLAGFVAFIAAGEMAFAYFKAHHPGWVSGFWEHPLNNFVAYFKQPGLWPIENHGEMAVLFCFVFLFIASRGSGILSIDALRGRARRG